MNVLVIWLVGYTATCVCFGYVGHRIIGRLVWALLDRDTKTILANHFGGKAVFLQLSSWPDQIKFDFAWRWTSKYHFVNSQDDPPFHCELRPNDGEDENLLTAIEMFHRNISQTKEHFVENLSFLIHLIGDLHQPLHITFKDHGGTRHYLQFQGRRVPLHLFYDTLMIRDMLRDKSEEAFALSLLQDASLTTQSPLFQQCDRSLKECAFQWAQESNMVNCKVVFRESATVDEHKSAVKRQLLRAALRISHLLPSLMMNA